MGALLHPAHSKRAPDSQVRCRGRACDGRQPCCAVVTHLDSLLKLLARPEARNWALRTQVLTQLVVPLLRKPHRCPISCNRSGVSQNAVINASVHLPPLHWLPAQLCAPPNSLPSPSVHIPAPCMSLPPPPRGQGVLQSLTAALSSLWGSKPATMHGQHVEQLNSILDELPGEQGAGEQPVAAGEGDQQRLYGKFRSPTATPRPWVIACRPLPACCLPPPPPPDSTRLHPTAAAPALPLCRGACRAPARRGGGGGQRPPPAGGAGAVDRVSSDGWDRGCRAGSCCDAGVPPACVLLPLTGLLLPPSLTPCRYLAQKEQDTGALLSRAQQLQGLMAQMAAAAGGDTAAAAAVAEMGRLVEELGVAAAEARASAAQLKAETERGKRSSAQVGAGAAGGRGGCWRGWGPRWVLARNGIEMPWLAAAKQTQCCTPQQVCCCVTEGGCCKDLQRAFRCQPPMPARLHPRPTWRQTVMWR